jgi:predicted transcriptional regulator YdeE
MKKNEIHLPEIKLVGISIRTNNKDEMDPTMAKISPTAQKFFQQALPNKITNRKNPGITYCAYTEYESDFTGDYTYFIGEEVSAFESIPDGLTTLTIPSQAYAKFTTATGPMPEVVINAWLKIWQMDPHDFGGQRNYHTDFELYDERAIDPKNTTLDIYIGIKGN